MATTSAAENNNQGFCVPESGAVTPGRESLSDASVAGSIFTLLSVFLDLGKALLAEALAEAGLVIVLVLPGVGKMLHFQPVGELL